MTPEAPIFQIYRQHEELITPTSSSIHINSHQIIGAFTENKGRGANFAFSYLEELNDPSRVMVNAPSDDMSLAIKQFMDCKFPSGEEYTGGKFGLMTYMLPRIGKDDEGYVQGRLEIKKELDNEVEKQYRVIEQVKDPLRGEPSEVEYRIKLALTTPREAADFREIHRSMDFKTPSRKPSAFSI